MSIAERIEDTKQERLEFISNFSVAVATIAVGFSMVVYYIGMPIYHTYKLHKKNNSQMDY